jgi:hypothetical protein
VQRSQKEECGLQRGLSEAAAPPRPGLRSSGALGRQPMDIRARPILIHFRRLSSVAGVLGKTPGRCPILLARSKRWREPLQQSRQPHFAGHVAPYLWLVAHTEWRWPLKRGRANVW